MWEMENVKRIIEIVSNDFQMDCFWHVFMWQTPATRNGWCKPIKLEDLLSLPSSRLN